jgi:molybdopterin/thiamine biosynthesis adenylyltransferase
MGREETMAMLDAGQVPERYLRNVGTIGAAGQARLLAARVAVVGAGGLGGTVIELLARYGVGYLRIIDGDTFAAHNLNRQLLATESSLGESKAAAAAARVARVNADVAVDAVPHMLDTANAAALLTGMDVIVDALDTIGDRLLLGRTARHLAIPLVHGAVAGFTGQVTTLLPGDPGLERIYHPPVGPSRGVETILGTPAATPAVVAALQAQEVVKLLTGVGQPLSRKLLYIDTEYNIFETLTLG